LTPHNTRRRNDERTDIRTHDGHETRRGVYALLDAVAGQSHGIDGRDHLDDERSDVEVDESSDETLFHEVIA
jgi:hypothetical protein